MVDGQRVRAFEAGRFEERSHPRRAVLVAGAGGAVQGSHCRPQLNDGLASFRLGEAGPGPAQRLGVRDPSMDDPLERFGAAMCLDRRIGDIAGQRRCDDSLVAEAIGAGPGRNAHDVGSGEPDLVTG